MTNYRNYWLLIRASMTTTAWKESKYGVISGPYFPVFSPNTRKYGPEITPYLDTFLAVYIQKWLKWPFSSEIAK